MEEQRTSDTAGDDAQTEREEKGAVQTGASGRDPVRLVVLAVLALAVLFFVWYVLADRYTPFTDQARIEALTVPIVPRVAGHVGELNVRLHSVVEEGDQLLRIDQRPFQLAVESAQAGLDDALQQVGAQTAGVEAAVAQTGDLEGNTEADDFDASGVLAGLVTWEADLFGRLRRSNEAALEGLLATEEAYRGVTIALVAQVAELYLALRDLDNRLAISEATADARRQSLEIIRIRHAAGMVSEVDVNQAEIQLADAEAAVEVFRRLRSQTENGLSFLIGSPPLYIPRGEALADQVFPPDLPAGLPSQLLERRPDILAAEHQLAAQTASIGVAEAIKYPSLTLTADVGASFASLTAGFLNLGADLFAPLFNAGQNQRRVEIEIARTEQALANYEQTILNAFREVEDAMVAVHRYEAEYATRLRQVEAARSAANLSWIRYEGGLTSYLEVLDVQRSEFSAELQASATLQLQLTSLVQLYRALGGGWDPGGGEEAP